MKSVVVLCRIAVNFRGQIRCASYEAERHLRGDVQKNDVLARNINQTTALLDGCDYTYVDGRPTPYGSKAVLRMEKQRKYTEKIIQLTREIDTAKATFKRRILEKEQEIQNIINSKLKQKGVKQLD